LNADIVFIIFVVVVFNKCCACFEVGCIKFFFIFSSILVVLHLLLFVL